MSLPKGKGVYIWQRRNICGGDAVKIADELEKSHTNVVAIKAQDGAGVWGGLADLINEIRWRGIAVGIWGYVYLRYDPIFEALATKRAVGLYNPDFFLIDAESHAKGQYSQAKLYAAGIKNLGVPVGLNSYWYPHYHLTLPWETLLSVSDFVCPQVYWRGSNPVTKYDMSKAQYAGFGKPFSAVAGDMYYEHGIKPTPGQVQQFLTHAQQDKDVSFTLMWSMDQMNIVPELWAAYSAFDYKTGQVHGSVYVPAEKGPLDIGVVTPWIGLNVRNAPNGKKVRALPRGTRVEVWAKSNGWGKIAQDKEEWVSLSYIKSLEDAHG